MQRENKRKPDNVLKMQGTYRKDRHGDPDLKLVFEEPDSYEAPVWLSDLAKKEWFRVTNAYKGQKALAEQDLSLLAAYCHLIGRLEKDPDRFPMSGHNALKGYAAMFGLGIINRCKVQLPSKPDLGNRFESVKKKAT